MFQMLALSLVQPSLRLDTTVRDAFYVAIAPVSPGLIRKDPLEDALAQGDLAAPAVGAKLGENAWKAVQADKDGWFEQRNGYLGLVINAPSDETILVNPQGASYFYANGEPQPGDVYEYGYVDVPVHLHAGANSLFFRCARGRVRVGIQDRFQPLDFDNRDVTTPDAIAGHRKTLWAAIPVRNATGKTVGHLSIEATAEDGRTMRTGIRPIFPYGVEKAGFRFDAPKGGKVQLRLLDGDKEIANSSISVRLRKVGETFKETFVSQIDDTVQYFGVNPATGRQKDEPKPALVLSLHGASVEAIGQADAYSSKSWLTLVAPTNRRPYGFDWEDWGRMDALEVLRIAKSQFDHDPSRIYLAGHSMGGHGTWQLGALYPDLFAAIGPSAGWISAYTYAGARRPENPQPVQEIASRSYGPGDTLAMLHNYGAEGVYILHGGADDNVPVTEARRMADLLSGFHHDYIYHEQPGQGHWWDLSPEPGADCVDWAPMYDFFSRHALPIARSIHDVDFSTANPQVSSKLRWVTIEQQNKEGLTSHIQIHADPHLRKFTGTTENVASFTLDLAPLFGTGPVSLDLDGQALSCKPTGTSITLNRNGATWTVGSAVPAGQKNPERYGPFRLALNHRMLFVYGTRGSAEENAWALAKARYDAETFWYRGNGSPEVAPDSSFDPRRDPDRDIVLYGNSDTNAAWKTLLGDSPVQVSRWKITTGAQSFADTGLACLFLRPRAGSPTALVAAVSGTGIQGFRVTNNLPYLQPMVGVPDLLIVGSHIYDKGDSEIQEAGFFGNDWAVSSGDFAGAAIAPHVVSLVQVQH